MALSKTNLQQIPQRIKDLAFGYVKESEQDNYQVIPTMVKYLCLVYLRSYNKDTIAIDQGINYNKIKMKDDCISNTSDEKIDCYLQNIACNGIHIWSFQCKTLDIRDYIGIATIDMDSKKAYALQLKGIIKGFGIKKEAVRCMRTDIVKMTLNMHDLTLSYSIEGTDFGANHIKLGKYRALIRINNNGRYKLLNYQHRI